MYDVVAQKRDAETVVENRKLDYELLERWIKYMEKPTDKYKYKEAWQAMMKRPWLRRQPAEAAADVAAGGGASARCRDAPPPAPASAPAQSSPARAPD